MGYYNIYFKGFIFDCNINYQPEEKKTIYYQGCDEEFEITNITLNGEDASELLESMIEEFYEETIKQLKNEY